MYIYEISSLFFYKKEQFKKVQDSSLHSRTPFIMNDVLTKISMVLI